jgi:putative glutamine amidotransferase
MLEERYQLHQFDMYFSAFPAAVYAAGGIAVELPYEAGAAQVISRLDGLVITGGQDVDPHMWGGDPACTIGPVDADRDAYEMRLIEQALQHHVPLLGVCRGMQLINVVLGGSLIGDLPREPIDHTSPGQATAGGAHEVETKPGSIANRLFGDRLMVNSLHHQGVEEAGRGVTISGRAPEGTAEILEADDGRVLGVQWHPEWLPTPDGSFRWLVHAASDRYFDCCQAG